eukprot:Phypoly_transcript_07608.p1 GENE.Phypoly_transcript_07608~~Phypoly_transcript_07608.p1  ORF type:complete len:489 (+),score=87.92 Phypoly_transcript_07608:79-1545(+)
MEIRQTVAEGEGNKGKGAENGCHLHAEAEERRMAVRQLVQHLILGIADEIVEVTNEEKRKKEEGLNIQVNSVIRRSIFPFMQAHSIDPVSTLFPSSTSHIVQPKVLKQKKNDSCGYYALYNVITIAAALTAPTDEQALTIFHSLRHRTRFWLFYNRIVSHLYKRADSTTSKYPWMREHIDKGILERPYINYLMDSGFLQGNIDITVLSDFSMTGMRHSILPIADLRKLSQVFANYKSEKGGEEDAKKEGEGEKDSGSERKENGHVENGEGERVNGDNERKANDEKNKVHAFLVGQSCHWISLVCIKFKGNVEVLVFDSRNHNLLTATHEEFMRIIDKAKEKIPDWKKNIYLCSLTEPKMTADLFHDCIVGARDIITSLLEHNMEGFLQSFEENVEKSELKDVWIVPFISWLEMYWPPPVVESNIVKVLQTLGVSKLSANTRSKFLRMAKTIRTGVGNFSECGIPVVQRFEAILQWLELEFSALPEVKV